MKLKRGTISRYMRFDQYRDLRMHTLYDIKLKMAYFSRCIRDAELRMNKCCLLQALSR